MPSATRVPFLDQVTDAHWRSLQYFSAYRVLIALSLAASASLGMPGLIAEGSRSVDVAAIAGGYFVLALLLLIGLGWFRLRFNRQLSIGVLLDIVSLTSLMFLGGGVRSGVGVLLLVTLAGAGLVGQGRLVLFYAAAATLSMLGMQLYGLVSDNLDLVDFFQAGLLCAGFFVVAITARSLARRIIANEQLARQRGIDLHNQTLISQLVIEQMQDGVLVLTRAGIVKQHNPQAVQLLGLSVPSGCMLAAYSTELARGFSLWSEHQDGGAIVVRAPASGMQLRVRFVATETTERDVVVLLEDMGRVQEQARQLKLAALGRLTASIAHEIRNPLSAIKHAGELLQEDEKSEMRTRLLRIVHDNAQRVERIVSDVLEVGRRDRAHRETVALASMLPALLDEFVLKEKVAPDTISLELAGEPKLFFDRAHLYQVLTNLLTNALRYSQRRSGSVRVEARCSSSDGFVEVHVIDDGPGVENDSREHIFEPFFTTHSRGTGLGLYIARELCDANGATLELLESDSGAHFRILGRVDTCQ